MDILLTASVLGLGVVVIGGLIHYFEKKMSEREERISKLHVDVMSKLRDFDQDIDQLFLKMADIQNETYALQDINNDVEGDVDDDERL